MYDDTFYEREDEVAYRSAHLALPLILERHRIQTVIDIGCGTGAWAAVAAKLGRSAIGVDHGVPRHLCRVETFVDCDLSNGYPCSGFDLAICLEVAEHLPESSAEPLVAGLARACAVLFSAATPGQPGVNHINCQPHDYWHERFLTHGFQWTHVGPTWPPDVADFYRRNAYLYERTQ